MNEQAPSKDQLSEQQIRFLLADAKFSIERGRALDSQLVSAWALEQLCEIALSHRAAHEPRAARKCTHCNGTGLGQVCCGELDDGRCCMQPVIDACGTCGGDKTISTIDQYIATLPADWHEDSSLEKWFPLTAQELKLQRDRIIDLERAAQPPVPEWQPIETAPKDGTLILTVVAGYQPGIYKWFEFEEGGGRWTPDPECFLEESHLSDWLDGCDYIPTHWMPLPSGPTKAPECGACDKPGEHCSNVHGICSRHGGRAHSGEESAR